LCAQLAAECSRVDVVDEGSLAVDLHHREPLAVPHLEFRASADVDLVELELNVGVDACDYLTRPLAEMTPLRVVERDCRYG
jgi:hypothetical protein